MKKTISTRAIHWFRQDLRLSDNPALTAAAQAGEVYCIYILDDENAGHDAMGSASRWWLHHSLKALDESLGGMLSVYCGDPKTIIPKLAKNLRCDGVYWNDCYEPWRIRRDQQLKAGLEEQGISVHCFNGALLWQPEAVLKADGTPYQVFTPFYRNSCLNTKTPREPLPPPKRMSRLKAPDSMAIADALPLPEIRWYAQMEVIWKMGEKAAQQRLHQFLQSDIKHYHKGRDYPAKQNVSRLSPHLHFGELSPNQAWYAAKTSGDSKAVDTFCKELAWREFSHTQLYYFPGLPSRNLRS
ncbi:MAG: cryptochrome/photolyase family protein, partial [Rickettsiales bacterium]